MEVDRLIVSERHSGVFRSVLSVDVAAGWTLLRGSVDRHGSDLSLSVVAVVKRDDRSIEIRYPLPVTRKGTILELLNFPEGVIQLELEALQSPDSYKLKALNFKAVGQVARVLRMYRRIIPFYFKLPRVRRQRAGLSPAMLLLDLSGAYAITGRFRAYSPAMNYDQWLDEFYALSSQERRLIRKLPKKLTQLPEFLICISASSQVDSDLGKTIESLHAQLYEHFKVLLFVDEVSETTPRTNDLPDWIDVYGSDSYDNANDLLQGMQSERRPAWVICLPVGGQLSEFSLFWLAAEIARDSSLRFIYSDHDQIKDGKRVDPVFKPDWAPELLRSNNYIGCAAAFRLDLFLLVAGSEHVNNVSSNMHEMHLRASELLGVKEIFHLPAVLFHFPEGKASLLEHSSPDRVAEHLKRLNVKASIEVSESGLHRVRYFLPEDKPLVSIIIPTRDALQQFKACVESVLHKSSFDNYEIIIVDNQSSNKETHDYFQSLAKNPKIRILPYQKAFNFSAINNFAARAAKGDILCLLNNDTQVISSDWLEEMLGHLLQPGVGVVGAKLYYGDGRIQHAGDVVGPGGCAHHLHAFIDKGDMGYCLRASLAQDLSAVTAACLLTHKALYLKLGGLDENNLPIAFNDVDYCLRARGSGSRVVWTPHAELYHHESVSRGKDSSPEQKLRARREVAYMRRRWRHLMLHDPFYNPNLSYERPDFSLSHAPMVQKPWTRK